MPPAPKTRVLVIGYGSTLRTDDAAGYRVTLAVESWRRPDVATVHTTQLTPELAALVAGAEAVFFVDARHGDPELGVQVQALPSRDEGSTSMAHAASPQSVLGLCRRVYCASPPCWLVSVPAVDFSIGEGLSQVTRRGIAQAVTTLDSLIARALGEPSAGSNCQVETKPELNPPFC